MKILLFALLFGAELLSQNLSYQSVYVDSLEDSIYIDLGVDTEELLSAYPGGNEYTLTGIIFAGTWTNDTLEVYAAMTETGTYYQVSSDTASAFIIKLVSNTWTRLPLNKYSGLRYLLFKTSEPEADNRTLYLIKKCYPLSLLLNE